eukprot:11264212-Prorocentrum_lima.AAC.1
MNVYNGDPKNNFKKRLSTLCRLFQFLMWKSLADGRGYRGAAVARKGLKDISVSFRDYVAK